MCESARVRLFVRVCMYVCDKTSGNRTGVGPENPAESEAFNNYTVVVKYRIFDNHSVLIKCFGLSRVLWSYASSIPASPVSLCVLLCLCAFVIVCVLVGVCLTPFSFTLSLSGALCLSHTYKHIHTHVHTHAHTHKPGIR